MAKTMLSKNAQTPTEYSSIVIFLPSLLPLSLIARFPIFQKKMDFHLTIE